MIDIRILPCTSVVLVIFFSAISAKRNVLKEKEVLGERFSLFFLYSYASVVRKDKRVDN